MKGIDIIDLIATVNRIEEKNLNAPFRCFKLIFEDGSGKHTIRYEGTFDESKSAVIHQLNKILKFPQNYAYVNVFITAVEPPEHDRTHALGKNSCVLEKDKIF